MEIRINNYSIDYKLQDEKKVADIVKYLTAWTAERELIIFRLEIDGAPHPIDKIPDMELDGINIVNFVIQSKSDIVFTSVEEGVRYCGSAIKFAEKSQKNDFSLKELSDLADGLEWLKGVLLSSLNILGIEYTEFSYKGMPLSDYLKEMKAHQDELRAFDKTDRASAWLNKNGNLYLVIKELLRTLLTCDEMKKLILNSVDSPDIIVSTLTSLKEALPGEVQNLENIAIAFQSGKDKEGSEKIQRFVDFIFSFSRACHHVEPVFGISTSNVIVENKSLFEKNREIHDLLNETIDVMENQDYISLADVLEYEMKPAIENIGQYIDTVIRQTESL